MLRFRRISRRWAALPLILVLTAATMTHAGTTGKPGPTTRPVTLSLGATLQGFDVATSASGTAYVGWISSPVNANGGKVGVHLCTVKPGTTSCAGGVQVTDAIDDNTASSLRVLVQKSGTVDLVWSYGNGSSASIGFTTASATGVLRPATDIGSAPSNGVLLDAAIAPDGSVWTVAGTGYTNGLQVRSGVSHTAVDIATPYPVDPAELAFTGSTAVIATQWAGYITKPAGYTVDSHGSWSPVHNVASTWTAGARVGLADTRSGLRLIASEPDADYLPVLSSWTGSAFAKPVLLGQQTGCAPSSHDLVTDASGRLADISSECEVIAVTNLPDTRHASVVRFSAGGTLNSGAPRVATTARGSGLAIWSIEAGASSDRLLMVPVLLPDVDQTVTSRTPDGSISVTGPVSCLPADTVGAAVKGRPAVGWHVQSESLKLGAATVHSTINGAALRAGATYRLKGTVTFAKGSSRRSGSATVVFNACPAS
jgi:hypothetical protein